MFSPFARASRRMATRNRAGTVYEDLSRQGKRVLALLTKPLQISRPIPLPMNTP